MSALKIAKRFRNEKECLDFLIKKRWNNEPKCAYCSSSNVSTHTEEGRTSRFQCSSCKKSFSVLVGTIFEGTKLSLIKWFSAIAIMIEAKKGMSALQLSRHLDVNYRTAWSICHKIRKAMNDKNLSAFGGVVQMDETYIHTNNDDDDKNSGGGKKIRSKNTTPVVGMSAGGKIKAFGTKNIMAGTLLHFARRNIVEGSMVHTDCNSAYNNFKNWFKHDKVKHAVEYVSKSGVHTNTVESFWGNLKRGIKGQFHHISKKYAQDYINEFEFRFNRRGFKAEVVFDELLGRFLDR
jgi:transposase-like protein